ncbi:hypothetical protein EVAR_62814_1 [Eumeta japonica]|uniref:Uncharacterized protein n=1 Tax=Eumeta variegata TaxID=151549 RepID=A0A4C2AFU3_EUMVA|nr:hypothetical protein EVAR_62814_1 [Eumeta japonica]
MQPTAKPPAPHSPAAPRTYLRRRPAVPGGAPPPRPPVDYKQKHLPLKKFSALRLPTNIINAKARVNRRICVTHSTEAAELPSE